MKKFNPEEHNISYTEFDNRYNMILHKNLLNNYYEKCTYDKNNRLRSYRDSYGNCIKYDTKGRVIYYKNAFDYIVYWKKYHRNGKLKFFRKLTGIDLDEKYLIDTPVDGFYVEEVLIEYDNRGNVIHHKDLTNDIPENWSEYDELNREIYNKCGDYFYLFVLYDEEGKKMKYWQRFNLNEDIESLEDFNIEEWYWYDENDKCILKKTSNDKSEFYNMSYKVVLSRLQEIQEYGLNL